MTNPPMDQPALCKKRLQIQERKTRNLPDLPKTMLVYGVVANDIVYMYVHECTCVG